MYIAVDVVTWQRIIILLDPDLCKEKNSGSKNLYGNGLVSDSDRAGKNDPDFDGKKKYKIVLDLDDDRRKRWSQIRIYGLKNKVSDADLNTKMSRALNKLFNNDLPVYQWLEISEHIVKKTIISILNDFPPLSNSHN